MKLIKINFLWIIAVVFFMACDKDRENEPVDIDETKDLHFIQAFTNDHHTIELFGISRELTVGYNKLMIRMTDGHGNYIREADIDWLPMMTMYMHDMTHQHSCPYSEIVKAEGTETLYEGYIVFVMAGGAHGDSDFWELSFDYNAAGRDYEMKDKIEVRSSETEYHKVYTSGMWEGGRNYLLALIEPTNPEIGTNDIVIGLYTSEEDGSFPIVDDFTIKADPRMPGMGNHGAPGNEDLKQRPDGLYQGKVGFSMSGYWKINLILEDETGKVVKGEPVTEENEESSLNFKLEF